MQFLLILKNKDFENMIIIKYVLLTNKQLLIISSSNFF